MVAPLEVRQALLAVAAERKAYDQAEAYYTGQVQERFASLRLRQLLQATGDSYRINFARTPVDVLLERTEITGWRSEDAGAQALLETAWEENELGLDAKNVHRMAYEFGDSYLIGWPDEESASNVALYAHDPRAVRVFYDPERPRRKSHAVQYWVAPGNDDNGLDQNVWWLYVNVYYPDRVEQYASSDSVGDTLQRLNVDFERIEMRLLDEVDNPTGIVPVFHFRTGRPYGRPEHADAYGPQDMINKVLITMMASIDYAGFPQRYVLTGSSIGGGDDFGDSPGNPMAVPAPTTSDDYRGLDRDSSMESSPGSTWLLSGDKLGVGQFAVANSDNFLAPAQSLIKMMASVTDTPFHYFDLSGDMPSGESLRAAEAPLNKKVEDREALFGVTWHEVANYVLALNATVADVQVTWAPVFQARDKEAAETAKLELDAGKPFEVVWGERGYSSEVVTEWRTQRDAEEARAAQQARDIAAAQASTALPADRAPGMFPGA